eukprot:scaffold32648_cov63-Phaeocystis_antarctica.AAC.2
MASAMAAAPGWPEGTVRGQRHRRSWWHLREALGLHCKAQAARALLWRPESCRAQARGRLEP